VQIGFLIDPAPERFVKSQFFVRSRRFYVSEMVNIAAAVKGGNLEYGISMESDSILQVTDDDILDVAT
jgi:hypothetical protein